MFGVSFRWCWDAFSRLLNFRCHSSCKDEPTTSSESIQTLTKGVIYCMRLASTSWSVRSVIWLRKQLTQRRCDRILGSGSTYRTPYAVVLMLWMVAGWWCCRAAPIQAVWSLKVKGWSTGQKLLWTMAQLVVFSSSCSKASRLRDSATWCLAVVPEGGATSLSSVVCNFVMSSGCEG